MKKKAFLLALLPSLLMAGCLTPAYETEATHKSRRRHTDTEISSVSESSTFNAREVRTACAGKMDNNLDTVVVLQAPGEDEPLSTMNMRMSASYADLFGSELNDIDPQDLVETMGDMLVATLSEQFDIPEEDITVTAGYEKLYIEIKISDIPGFLSKATGQEVEKKDVTFRQAKADLAENLICD